MTDPTDGSDSPDGSGHPDGSDGRTAPHDAGSTDFVPVPGSERTPVPEARRVADAEPSAPVSVTVVLRRRPDADLRAPTATDPGERRRERARRAGADPDELAAVTRHLSDAGLRTQPDQARRTVTAEGTVATVDAAFGVGLGRYEGPEGAYRGREGPVRLPAGIAPYVLAVLGLDDRAHAATRIQHGPTLDEGDLPEPGAPANTLLPDPPAGGDAAAVPTKPAPLWTTQVAALYDFPTDADGRGQTIGIIELGGGYTDAELDTYFAKVGVGRPAVTAVPVGRGRNRPGGEADGEVLLDIEVAGTVAPGAALAVYFAPNTDGGFHDALSTAVHDTTHAASVISISWGGPEDDWTPQARTALEAALADAVAVGVTVLVAAGDHGAGDGSRRKDGRRRVDYPAASPSVVACGGTALVGASTTITAETVWNDHDGWATGGGVSSIFPPPQWQAVDDPQRLRDGDRTGRGVPDLSGNADIATGYIVLVHGQWGPVGGTSAVAPLYAGLVALMNQAPPVDGATPVHQAAPGRALPDALYAAGQDRAGLVRDITDGDNGTPATPDLGPAVPGFPAQPGWDACTGHGSLRGRALRDHLAARRA